MRPLLRPVLLVASALGLAGVVTVGATGLIAVQDAATRVTVKVAVTRSVVACVHPAGI